MYSRREAIGLAVGLAAVSFLYGCERDAREGEFVIGGVLPLSGDGASFGDAASKGARLAVDIYNRSKAEGAASARWVVEDSRGDPAAAAGAARKLIDVNGANALIGGVTSAATHALIPIATSTRTPVISPAASDPALSGASPFFARVWPSDIFEAGVIADHARQQGYDRIAAVYTNDDYGTGFFEAFRSAVGSDSIVVNAPFPTATSDFRALIERIRSSDPDALLLVSLPERARLFLTQAAEAGLDLPILATGSIEDPQIAELRSANRIVFASPAPPADSPARQTFEQEFRRAYGEAPGVLADTGYDAAMLLLQAQQAAETPEGIMEWIKSRRSYSGASGELSIDQSGDVVKPYRLKQGRNGAFEFL